MQAQDLFPHIQKLELPEQLALLNFLVQLIQQEVAPASESQQTSLHQPSIEHFHELSKAAQDIVFEVVEYLRMRDQKCEQKTELDQWVQFSLNAAMRGLEDEPAEYTIENLRETF
ncbi:hypothetical protein PN498_09115 [Oscillatoria sp. CS-180]|uniref:hypothetical protein n=1 Tax=Oscillatoria sp. CS-180 TaxID=3021720 RepID=UPI00232B9A69|nr:hypothetical protein [Oscillatoria sp. CS-180]MDB9526144.1 hypothetical protein [Oscillatoria sp. CS-180]